MRLKVITVFKLMEGRWTVNWHGLVELPILVGTSPPPPHSTSHHHSSWCDKDQGTTSTTSGTNRGTMLLHSLRPSVTKIVSKEGTHSHVATCASYSGAVTLSELSIVMFHFWLQSPVGKLNMLDSPRILAALGVELLFLGLVNCCCIPIGPWAELQEVLLAFRINHLYFSHHHHNHHPLS